MLAPYATFIFGDSHGRTKRKSVQLQTQATLVDYQAVITAFSSALDAIIDLECVKIELTLPATGTFAGEAESNVDVGATFSGVLYNKQGMKASFKVPGVTPSYANEAGEISVADADIAAVLAFFVNATPYDAYVSDGETIDHWVKGSLDK